MKLVMGMPRGKNNSIFQFNNFYTERKYCVKDSYILTYLTNILLASLQENTNGLIIINLRCGFRFVAFCNIVNSVFA